MADMADMTSVTSVTQKAAGHGDVETIRDTSMAMKVLLETHRHLQVVARVATHPLKKHVLPPAFLEDCEDRNGTKLQHWRARLTEIDL